MDSCSHEAHLCLCSWGIASSASIQAIPVLQQIAKSLMDNWVACVAKPGLGHP